MSNNKELFFNEDLSDDLDDDEDQALVETPADSVIALKRVEFDPMERMAKVFNRFEAEDEYWQNIREKPISNILTKVNVGVKQRNVRYSAVAHTSALHGMLQTAKELLPYQHAKIPTALNLNTPPPPALSIFLEDGGNGAFREVDPDAIDGEFVDVAPGE